MGQREGKDAGDRSSVGEEQQLWRKQEMGRAGVERYIWWGKRRGAVKGAVKTGQLCGEEIVREMLPAGDQFDEQERAGGPRGIF